MDGAFEKWLAHGEGHARQMRRSKARRTQQTYRVDHGQLALRLVLQGLPGRVLECRPSQGGTLATTAYVALPTLGSECPLLGLARASRVEVVSGGPPGPLASSRPRRAGFWPQRRGSEPVDRLPLRTGIVLTGRSALSSCLRMSCAYGKAACAGCETRWDRLSGRRPTERVRTEDPAD